MEAGGDPARFWTITPAAVSREMQAMIARRRADHDDLAWLAWHTAALPLMKKFPPLTDLLSDAHARRIETQSPDELDANLKLAFGWTGKDAET